RRAGRPHLYDDLLDHDARGVRGDPGDAPRGWRGRAGSRPRRACSHQSGAGKAQGRYRRHRLVQSPVLRLSRTADRCCCRSGEVAVLMRLDPTAEAAGARLVFHDTIGSTNAEALRLARLGERGPLWVAAGSQTAGRGRRGRTWVSEPGNLYASLLLNDPAPPAHFPELSFVAALALRDAV